MRNNNFPTIEADAVRKIGILGGGTIGASWAAYFLARGLRVVMVDPVVSGADLHASIEKTWPMLAQLGLSLDADPSRVTLCSHIDNTLADVDFIQECSPERLAHKQTLLSELEAVIRSDIIIASSTSSLLASDIQANCAHPERVLVGHPFNPPHLLPLVEVVAGSKTAPVAVDWAMDFYSWIGKAPVRVKKEAVGHIANRLTAALYREVVNIVAEGIGTAADVDAVMTTGPGLRWALMGPNLTYHLGGGSGGIAHYMAHLGPTQEARWQTLGNPKLTDEVKAQIVVEVLEIVGERTIEELAEQRDDRLVRLRMMLEQD